MSLYKALHQPLKIPIFKPIFNRIAKEILLQASTVYKNRNDLKQEALHLIEAKHLYKSLLAEQRLEKIKKTDEGLKAL